MDKPSSSVPSTFEQESQDFSQQYKLSNREFDVVKALLRNVTNSEEIAKTLGISTHTVNNHLKSIFEKTSTNSKTEILACFLKFAADRMKNHKMFARRPKALIIDDEESICEHIAAGLSERGMKTYTTTDPTRVIDLTTELNLDVIICDVRMPEVDGVDLLKDLRKIAVLNPFDEKELKNLLRMSKIRKYQPEELIFGEGYLDTWIYFLVSGSVRVMKNKKELTVLDKRGDIFGEMGPLDGSPRSASIYAVGTTVCLAMDTDYIDKLAGRDRVAFGCILYHIFARILAERLRIANDKLVEAKADAGLGLYKKKFSSFLPGSS